MRNELPPSVGKLTKFIFNQQINAITKLQLRSLVYGITVSDRDSVIYAIYVDACTDAVWLKDLSIAECEELVSCIFIDDFSKSKNKPMLPLTLRHCTIAHKLRLEQDKNWKRVAELSLYSLRGGDFAPSLADIIQDNSITWEEKRLNILYDNAIDPNTKRNHASSRHILNCPYCAIKLQIDQVFSKTEVSCPSCGKSFNVQP